MTDAADKTTPDHAVHQPAEATADASATQAAEATADASAMPAAEATADASAMPTTVTATRFNAHASATPATVTATKTAEVKATTTATKTCPNSADRTEQIKMLTGLLALHKEIGRVSPWIMEVCYAMRAHGITAEEIGSTPEEIIKLACESRILSNISAISSLSTFAKTLPAQHLQHLIGKKILDLGCGNNQPHYMPIDFSPKLCCLLYAIGADPMGIDISDLTAEVFETHQVNLAKPGALDFLPDSHFDYVHTRNLVGQNPTPELTNKEHLPLQTDVDDITAEIYSQARRLLKEGGFLIFDDEISQKTNGSLTPFQYALAKMIR